LKTLTSLSWQAKTITIDKDNTTIAAAKEKEDINARINQIKAQIEVQLRLR
jgi:chaperonin GroEL